MRSRILPVLALATLAPFVVNAAATIVIVNFDDPGVGFNDPTPVAAVGGNPGTTLGQQRLLAFQAAANKWGATLTSNVIITVAAYWDHLSCNSSGAVLGSAGATEVFADFPGAILAGHWYGKALTNKLYGADGDPGVPDIVAGFNIDLGKTGCLDGTFFYLGLDGNHGANVDLVTVLEHEFAHGLGFQTFTSGSTGAPFLGLPTVTDAFLMNSATSKTWDTMTNAERAASALSGNKLVWTGPNVTAGVPSVLQAGSPNLRINAPASVAGNYLVGTASFGPALTAAGLTAEIMPVVDQANGTGLACTTLSAANALAVSGKIGLVDRGGCTFNVKAARLQAAGAVGMIVVDNVAGSPPPGLGGTDGSITIPAVRITLGDGNALKVALSKRSRTHSGVFGFLGVDLTLRSGADNLNHALMYAPNPYQSGSSVSHFDVSAFPNLLMEPAINGDLTHEVTVPTDLTFAFLKDIGWN
ncbi:PA domain-containing protein [Paludibaculum fermentans]|uniref:Peptidase n=1 Tax=Paludibaculum fermentans TaxID=1473598 RepID=A0A7S7NSH3_PALFE|nr:PA domain-containing protein [Paludibaculum fermentans]QOY88933.1 peptidase [Paludibaculum fermentans]